MRTEVNVNANMLSWAIARAGYDMHELTSKFPKLPEWLANKKKPTVKQLEDFSKKVHLPFGYLLLDTPPDETIPFPFFRSLASAKQKIGVNLYDTILLIQKRQEWLIDYLEDSNYEPLPFVGSYNKQSAPIEVATAIKKELQLDDLWARAFNTIENALNYLTGKIEELGVTVSFNSVVENNNSRPISIEECRGFVMVDKIAPFMFINSADGKAAQMFTLVHELAHVWIGESAGFDIDKLLPANDPVELLCDSIAAEFLVPSNTFIETWIKTPDIDRLSQYFKVSKIVIARRALDLGKISKKQFFQFYNAYITQIKQKKESQSNGGDFYATQKKRISVRFAALVDRALNENKLLYRDAYKLTGLKGDTYQNFIAKAF